MRFKPFKFRRDRHHVRLVYRDGAFEIGAVISFVAWAICLVRLFRPPRKGTDEHAVAP